MANNTVDIDFANGVDIDDLVSDQVPRRGAWWHKLDELRRGVTDGDGAYNTFYKVAEYDRRYGAVAQQRQLRKRQEDGSMPADIDFEPRVVIDDDGTARSELWAAVVDPADIADVDEDEVEEDGDVEEAEEAEDDGDVEEL